MRYTVTHRTTYTYDADVLDSHGLAHISPRSLPGQRVHDLRVRIEPQPSFSDSTLDGWGNIRSVFHVSAPHSELIVEAKSDIDVAEPSFGDDALATPWELSRPLLHPHLSGAWAASEFALESALAAHADGVYEYAADVLTPSRPIGEAIVDLTHRIWSEFTYDSTATTVTSTVEEVLRQRAGVCQDFAHLAIACLRSHGIAARYVSGYLATQPPPGKERIVGADASHAWLAVWLPHTDDWLATDPTNDQLVGERYVTVAWGRDYGDVSPVKGIIVSSATTSNLAVSVDVAPNADGPPPLLN